MAPGEALSLEEAEPLLERAWVALLATRSEKARPFVTPIWFVLDQGALHLVTGSRSWAFRNISTHPRVTLLFGGERAAEPHPTLRVRGEARAERGLPPLRVLLRMGAKYYLPARALGVEMRHRSQWRLRMRYYGGTEGGAGYLRVVPTSAERLTRP